MVWPDRTPHPSMYEFKKLTQPIGFSFKDKQLTITNEQYFTDMSWLKGQWQVKVNGRVVDKGPLKQLNTAPGKSAVLTLPLKQLTLKADEEAFLCVSFTVGKKTSWCAAGHELAWEQFKLKAAKISATDKRAGRQAEQLPCPTVTEGRRSIKVKAADLTLVFNKNKGELSSYKHNGTELFVNGPRLNLWRAATDNDGIRNWTGQESKPMGKWLAARLDKLIFANAETSFKQAGATVEISIRQTAHGRGCKYGVKHLQIYTISADGTVSVQNRVSADKRLPELPRIGVTMQLASGMEQLEWFGCGPHESYCDRKAGNRVDLYQGTVTDQYVPYILPQEHGNKVDVRWMSLSNREKTITFKAHKLMECSASHYTAAALFASLHTNELKPIKETVVNIDYQQRGLGSGSAGEQTLEQYRIQPGTYEFGYTIGVE